MMSRRLDAFAFVTPETTEEALAILAADLLAHPFAGGTDLMVLLDAGHLAPGRYVNLFGLPDLSGIEIGDEVAIGALATYTQIRESSELAREYPMLGRAAAETGGIATQNRGTIGGNIANASPAADTPPALLAYDAELELRSASATRRVPYHQFHLAYKKMDLMPGEIITRIFLPRRGSGWQDYYRKVGTRRAQAISKVCFAGSVLAEGSVISDLRIAMSSVAPYVLRCRATEAVLRRRSLDDSAIADARSALAKDIAPIDDIRSTAEYRLRVAQNLLKEFCNRAIG
jgi:CO/xanthine dehydrogenase FAD-binding subunit